MVIVTATTSTSPSSPIQIESVNGARPFQHNNPGRTLRTVATVKLRALPCRGLPDSMIQSLHWRCLVPRAVPNFLNVICSGSTNAPARFAENIETRKDSGEPGGQIRKLFGYQIPKLSRRARSAPRHIKSRLNFAIIAGRIHLEDHP